MQTDSGIARNFWERVTNFWTRRVPKLIQKPVLSTGRANVCNYSHHHASIGGISSRSDEKVFKTGVVLKKSSIFANCTRQKFIGHAAENFQIAGGLFGHRIK
jgi:hypothetical protein